MVVGNGDWMAEWIIAVQGKVDGRDWDLMLNMEIRHEVWEKGEGSGLLMNE